MATRHGNGMGSRSQWDTPEGRQQIRDALIMHPNPRQAAESIGCDQTTVARVRYELKRDDPEFLKEQTEYVGKLKDIALNAFAIGCEAAADVAKSSANPLARVAAAAVLTRALSDLEKGTTNTLNITGSVSLESVDAMRKRMEG